MKQTLKQTVEQTDRPDLNPVPSRPVTKDEASQPLHSLTAGRSSLRRELPARPDPAEGREAYSTWLDSMCAHVRAMAQRCAAEYHREQLAHHEARLAELERAA